jgi:hypothetical protein
LKNKKPMRPLRKESLGQGHREIKEVFSVKTKYGVVENVPVVTWKELFPHWRSICRAIFEVLTENDFSPYTATLKRPDGFVASSYYWKKSLKDPMKISLSEAKYFIYKLEEKQYFLDSIREFNQKTRTNWLEEKNIETLGGYLYSFLYVLKPVLRTVKKGTKNYLKPVIRKQRL